MSIHRAYCELIPNTESLIIDGEEAHHALRTKRLVEGDRLEILDGKGKIALARIIGTDRVRKGEWTMRLEIEQLSEHPQPSPKLTVCSGVPKGPRLETLIEGLSQAGASEWKPLLASRSVVDPRPAKLGRLGRVAQESGKQCGRPWTLQIGRTQNMQAAIQAASGSALILADAIGENYQPSGAASLSLLVGPEGGFEQGEIEIARAAGAQIARFGQHTMRIETAATVAAGVILELERRAAPQTESPVPSGERKDR